MLRFGVGLFLLGAVSQAQVNFSEAEDRAPQAERRSFAQAKAPRKPQPESRLAAQYRMDLLAGLQARGVKDSVVNPGNKVAELDSSVLYSEFRPEYKLKYLSKGKFVFRPRAIFLYHQIRDFLNRITFNRADSHFDLSEFFLDWVCADWASITLGLQNYQWGPAELLSPSNPLFHFSNNQKSYLYQDKGKVIARANITLGGSLSLVLLQNFLDSGDKFWIADRAFEKISLAKLELRDSKNANRYVGIVGGEQEGQKKFGGLYGNLSFAEVFSVYLDSKIVEGSIAYYPYETSPQVFLLDTKTSETTKAQTSAITGLRWEGAWDVRAEFYYNSAGYNGTDIKNALKSFSVANPLYLFNLNRFSGTSLDLPGQEYFYLSVRVPDLGQRKDGTYFLRYFYSLQDSSAGLQMSLDKPLNDHIVINIEASLSLGTDQNELALTETASGFAGLKYSW